MVKPGRIAPVGSRNKEGACGVASSCDLIVSGETVAAETVDLHALSRREAERMPKHFASKQ